MTDKDCEGKPEDIEIPEDDRDLRDALNFTKAVKLSQRDLEFIEDLVLVTRNDKNFSKGLRICILVARKLYEERVKELKKFYISK